METRTANHEEYYITRNYTGIHTIKNVQIHEDKGQGITMASFMLTLHHIDPADIRKTSPKEYYAAINLDFDTAIKIDDICWFTNRKEAVSHILLEDFGLKLTEEELSKLAE